MSTETNPPDAHTMRTRLGRTAYESYGEFRKWKTHNGGDMPTWEGLLAQPTGAEVQEGWCVAASGVQLATKGEAVEALEAIYLNTYPDDHNWHPAITAIHGCAGRFIDRAKYRPTPVRPPTLSQVFAPGERLYEALRTAQGGLREDFVPMKPWSELTPTVQAKMRTEEERRMFVCREVDALARRAWGEHCHNTGTPVQHWYDDSLAQTRATYRAAARATHGELQQGRVSTYHPEADVIRRARDIMVDAAMMPPRPGEGPSAAPAPVG